MTSELPIKVGQIGLGHNHAHEKISALRKLPDFFEVVGVVEDTPQWRKKRGDMPGYKGLAWLKEDELLGNDEVQAVFVETDVPFLNATAMRCLEAGKHIHMDKPAFGSLSEFRRILDEAEKRKLVVQMGYMFRGNPAIQFCFEAVKSGMIGEAFEIDAVMSRMDGQDYRNWLSGFQGGAFYIFGCHLLDLVLTMMGEPDRIVPFMKQTRPGDGVVDNGMAVLEYRNATAVLRASVIEVEGFLRRQLTVCGDKGTIEIYPIEPFNQRHLCLPELRLTLMEPCGKYKAGVQRVVFDQMHDRYTGQLQELAEVITGVKENPYSTDYEFALQKCLHTACGVDDDLNSC